MKPTPVSLPRTSSCPRLDLMRVAIGCASISAAGMTAAQGEDDPIDELAPLVITASADASAEGLPEAYAGGQVARGGRVGLLGPLDYMSTPFNLTSYTEELIENQQAQSVGDVLLNDPAVRVARGFGNFQQVYKVRGLPIYSDDMTYNGLYGLLPRQYLAAELVERVEVLRGANAFLNGAAPGGSALGGSVNVLPKRAGLEPMYEFTAGVQSGGQLYGAADLSQRLADDRLGVRFNAALRDGDTAVDGESMSLGLMALGLDWRGERLRLSADLGYQDLQRDATQPSVTFAPGIDVLPAPDASVSIAQPWTFSDESDLFGVLRGEFDINDCWTVWAAAGTRQGDEDNSFANPTVTANDGTTSAYRFDNVREDSVWTGEIGIRGDVNTGPVRHRPSLSLNAYQLESKNAYGFSSFAGFSGNLYRPMPVIAPDADFFVGGDLGDPLVTEKTRTSSVALADMISLFDERLILIAGLRYQTIETLAYDYNSGAFNSGYSEGEWTPVGGVLYQFTPQLAGYVNYIEGLTKGDIAPATSGGVAVANAGEALAPYVTEQLEAGLKFDLGCFGGALSVFQSEQPIAGLDASGIYDVLYDQRYRGLELSAFGEPFEGVRLMGGVSLLDTERRDLDQIGSPTTQLNLVGEWDLPFVPGVTLDGRLLYTSSQYADAANTQRVPSWTRFDLGLRYAMMLDGGQELTFRARVENVADEDYWASAGGFPGAGYLTIGAPRTFMLSASCSF